MINFRYIFYWNKYCIGNFWGFLKLVESRPAAVAKLPPPLDCKNAELGRIFRLQSTESSRIGQTWYLRETGQIKRNILWAQTCRLKGGVYVNSSYLKTVINDSQYCLTFYRNGAAGGTNVTFYLKRATFGKTSDLHSFKENIIYYIRNYFYIQRFLMKDTV